MKFLRTIMLPFTAKKSRFISRFRSTQITLEWVRAIYDNAMYGRDAAGMQAPPS